MENIRYFEVRKEVLTGKTEQYNVLIDGSPAGTSDSEGEAREITTGFIVYEYGEDGSTENVRFYPVQTNTENYTNNEEEVLAQIIADHQPTEWQNNEW